METQIKTAKEMLAEIEADFFRGVDLAAASLLKDDERRNFRLLQVERLLTEEHGSLPLAMWLSDMFWTADEGRKLPETPNPLMSLQKQQTLTDEEMARLHLILEVAGLCHDLSLHFTFDLNEAFGIKNVFWVSNKQLVEWLSTTAYERIAMHTAYTLRKHAVNVYVCGHYQPAQDAMAELFSVEYRELVRDPQRTKIPPRNYVKIITDAILQIERHWQRGRRLKLRPDLVMLHDEIYGVVPLRFDKGVLKAAQALYDYMDKEVYGRMAGNNPFAPEVMKLFAQKVREVRSDYLAKGWVADDSLEFAYLMAHAQNCGYGIWREEDEAL
jgi:hypothetical protein